MSFKCNKKNLKIRIRIVCPLCNILLLWKYQKARLNVCYISWSKAWTIYFVVDLVSRLNWSQSAAQINVICFPLLQPAGTKRAPGVSATLSCWWRGTTSWSRTATLPANRTDKLRKSAKPRTPNRRKVKVIVSYRSFIHITYRGTFYFISFCFFSRDASLFTFCALIVSPHPTDRIIHT